MTTDVLSQERAATVLRAYGADPERWPESEREAMQRTIAQSPELQAMAAAEESLDQRLSTHSVAVSLSVDDVLAQLDSLPAQQIAPSVPVSDVSSSDVSSQSGWFDEGLFAGVSGKWWRPAVAACAPLALGVALGVSDIGVSEDWQSSEQYLFAPGYEESIDG